jgi:hypothetical protein
MRQLLVEVLHVEVEVLLAVEPQHLFEHGGGDPARASSAAPPVEEGVEAELLVLLLPPPHVARRDA